MRLMIGNARNMRVEMGRTAAVMSRALLGRGGQLPGLVERQRPPVEVLGIGGRREDDSGFALERLPERVARPVHGTGEATGLRGEVLHARRGRGAARRTRRD